MEFSFKLPRPLKCPYSDSCCSLQSPTSARVIRKGSYRRSSDSVRVFRFQCTSCGRRFSDVTFDPFRWEKKRPINPVLRELLCSGVSQRRSAKILGVNRKTIVRKFLRMGDHAATLLQASLVQRVSQNQKVLQLHFDEMESFEHSKCLPLSIPLLVEDKTRKILGFDVCSMPAKGLLAAISRKKYGPRADDREGAAISLFKKVQFSIAEDATVMSDQKTTYPKWIRGVFPKIHHKTFKGLRGCVVGQGELKNSSNDPMFSFNHTAAMLRANINRLFRRTWCTTKKAARLRYHISLYSEYHNAELT